MDSTEYGKKDLKLYRIKAGKEEIEVHAYSEKQALIEAQSVLERRRYYCDT